jgi:hypothetical protein
MQSGVHPANGSAKCDGNPHAKYGGFAKMRFQGPSIDSTGEAVASAWG